MLCVFYKLLLNLPEKISSCGISEISVVSSEVLTMCNNKYWFTEKCFTLNFFIS